MVMTDLPPPPPPTPQPSPQASTTPPPPPGGSAASVRTPSGVGKALRVLFIVLAIAQGLFLAAIGNRYAYLSDVKDGNEELTIARANEVDDYVSTASGLVVGLSIAVFVLMIIFLYRLVVHTRRHGGDLRHSNGMAIGGFFIPFANIFIPYRLFTDVGRFLRARAPGRKSALVIFNWWWWTYLAGLIMLQVATNVESDDIDAVLDSDAYSAVGVTLLIASAICAAISVRRFTDASRDVFG